MIKFQFKRVQRAKLPELRLPVDVLEDFGELGEASILDNIKKQQQADGGALKENAPITKKRKRKKRRPLLSLVDRLHRFVRVRGQSWAHEIHVRSSTVKIRAATQELRNIAEYVQRMGYTGWFGINERARAAMRARLRKWIREEFKKARRKR